MLKNCVFIKNKNLQELNLESLIQGYVEIRLDVHDNLIVINKKLMTPLHLSILA
jgi:hypothetical protein